ncbi:sodium:proton antiporter [Halorussus sp. MSC15.2]|uniref:cation:proton antiporter n=1 Tax=Halorussus sp. MSC15.2 TaxID=2283638 RepID=UPI0013D252DC|nr:cation:proton antiporter [Halorussus sp. MSC15.2]NEU59256.1 sodium:proton antiporter [Halorussus sp. MSC15.2]
MAAYEAALLLIGIAILGAVVLPRVLSDKPMSFPLIYVTAGVVLFSLPLGVEVPDPVEHGELAERLTEFVVIIALMGAGLKLDRPFDPRAWSSTWRLLGITMPLTIVATALLGWGVLGTLLPTAVLLGAIVSPTDPVLASDVQASPPTEGMDEEADPTEQEGEVRFALTSEAGLNDGLAFPFTHLAIAMAAAAGTSSLGWLGDWFLVHFLYEIVVGVVMGYLAGQVLARFIFSEPVTTQLGKVMEGAEALAATLITYGVTELVHGYGFIAVFVAALELRHYEWEHEYYVALHDYAVMIERIVMASVLVLFGGAIAGGLLAPLTLLDVVVGLTLIFVVRPLAGVVGLLGSPMPWSERLVVSSFGIRGIGSFYYLAFALNEASFGEIELLVAADKLWALIGFVALASIVVHGVSANWVMNVLDRTRDDERTPESTEAEVS